MNSKSELETILESCNKSMPSKGQEPASDREYLWFYSKISKIITDFRVNDRKKISEMMDTVFDGNLHSLDGFSSNKYIETVQKKANDLMMELSNEHDICPLDTRSLNIILNLALSDIEETDQDQYYQSIHQNRNGEIISSKLSNLSHNIRATPQKIFSILKTGYLTASAIISKELFSFVWVFIDTILFFTNNSRIIIHPNEVAVLLYIQKYASPFISEDELIEHILKKDLSFDDNIMKKYSDLLDNDRNGISNILNYLAKIKIISIEEGNIEIVEKIDLEIKI